MSKKSIMITGVSTGIGLGTLSYFVKIPDSGNFGHMTMTSYCNDVT